MRDTENTVFALSPIPLGVVKAGVQQVAVPLAVTAAASHTPFVGPLVGTAIKYGADAFQSGTHHLALEAMSSFGQSVAESIPSGIGLQSGFNAISGAMSDATLAGQDLATQAIGAVGTAVMLGRTAQNAAVLAFKNVQDMTINEFLDRSRLDIQKTQAFLQGTAAFVRRQGLKAELAVEQGLAKYTPYQPKTQSEDQKQMADQNQEQEPETLNTVSGKQNQEEPQAYTTSKTSDDSAEPIKAAATTGQSSEQAEDYVLRNLVDKLKQNRVEADRFVLTLNGEQIFKMNGSEVDKSTHMTEAHQKMLQQALEDPAAFGGNLKITVDGKTLLHIKDGRLLDNSMGLAKDSVKVAMDSPNAAPENVSQGLWDKYGAGQPNDVLGLSTAAKAAAKEGIKQADIRGMLRQSSFYKEQAADNQKTADNLVKRTAKNAIQQANKQSQNASQKQEQKQEQKQSVAPTASY
ncbi:hypothetical protein ACSYAD_18510 [Acaryochloris marina NIES-2412]|uniref:hypothetical protein n=1 Tax=Acaryochloris marina TaxID=155978 RepID=UPI0040595A30